MDKKGFKNHKIAWGACALMVLAGVFFGALTTYNSLRGDVEDEFFAEAMPTVRRAVEFAFNLQTIAAAYLTPEEIENIGISRLAQIILNSTSVDEIYINFTYLNRASWEIYDRLLGVAEAESRRLLEIYHNNFLEQDLRLEQARYNNQAAEFNAALAGNLGFLVRNLIIQPLPTFN